MNVLLKKALTWTLVFLLWTFVSAWLFVLVEKTEKDDVKEKNQLLRSLYKSMATKYNMSIEEFNNFSKVAHDALADPKLEWNFFAAVDFVFQSLTTIGKKKIHCTPLHNSIPFSSSATSGYVKYLFSRYAMIIAILHRLLIIKRSFAFGCLC